MRRGQEHWEYWDWEDTVDWTDRTGPGQADMDGQNGSSSICARPHGAATDGKKKKKIPDRVTLKKEIGLLSACTIIIGEAGKQESCHLGSALSFTSLHNSYKNNFFSFDFMKMCCRTTEQMFKYVLNSLKATNNFPD